MFHFPIPQRPPIAPSPPAFVWFDGVFSPQELDRIRDIAFSMPGKRVGVGKSLQYDPLANRSVARWLQPNDQTHWIYMRLTGAIADLNAMHYQFDITGLDEELYYVTYDGAEEGHYDWHADVHQDTGFTRKLSMTLQMSHPNDYEGGGLEFNNDGKPELAAKDRGRMLMFPSYTLHRVRPVTRGVRAALVSWIVGPRFR